MTTVLGNFVYVYDNPYNDVSHNCLAGMFFASSFENTSDPPPISILRPDETIEIAHRILPRQKSVTIEIPYVDCFPYVSSKLESQLGSVAASAINICEFTVIGTRYDSDGGIFSTMICGFDGFDTIQGFVAYIQSSGIYPAEMIIFQKKRTTDNGEYKTTVLPIDMDIDFIDVKSHRRSNNWVAPPSINLRYNGQIFSFVSPSPKGWLREDLKNAVIRKWDIIPKIAIHKVTEILIYYDVR